MKKHLSLVGEILIKRFYLYKDRTQISSLNLLNHKIMYSWSFNHQFSLCGKTLFQFGVVSIFSVCLQFLCVDTRLFPYFNVKRGVKNCPLLYRNVFNRNKSFKTVLQSLNFNRALNRISKFFDAIFGWYEILTAECDDILLILT